tara:strand:- start:407 stop:616 length:210 start_codon:yes stop_codon:yes gene_type:complete
VTQELARGDALRHLTLQVFANENVLQQLLRTRAVLGHGTFLVGFAVRAPECMPKQKQELLGLLGMLHLF